MQIEPMTILEYQTPLLGLRPNASFFLVLSYFMLFGILLGAQGVIWPEVLAALGVSKGIFGTAQLLSPAVAIVFLLLGGFWTQRLGLRRLVLPSLILLSLSCDFLAGARIMIFFLGALALGGMGNGLMETAMNAAALDWEQANGRRVMNFMHAGFSAGAITGALSAGTALSHGWDFKTVCVALIVPCALVYVATLVTRLPPAPRHNHDPHPLSTLKLITSDRDLRRLALLGVLGVIGESVAFVWAVIYLQQLGAPPILSAASFALFNAAMLCGRLVNAPILARRGFRFSMAISGTILILASILLLVTTSLAMVTAGFILLGLGVAGVVPTVLSRGSDLAPGMSGAVSGGIMAAAYIGFIVCPPAIGWVAQATSLRTAMGSVGISGALVLVLVMRDKPLSTNL